MKEVFILGGQSNMVGMNTIPTPAPTYANAARIFYKVQPWTVAPWDQNVHLPMDISNPASGAWVQAVDPIHSTPGCGVGPGIAMADRYISLKDPDGSLGLEVGLVPCGWGGSSMNWEWSRTFNSCQAFGMMLARTLDAMSWGAVKALVFYQGEQEAGLPAASLIPTIWPQWSAGLYDLIAKVREAVGDRNLPAIIGQLGDDNNGLPNWAAMKSQINYCKGVSKYVAVVEGSDTSTTDGIHRTAAAQITLGHQFADALWAMQ